MWDWNIPKVGLLHIYNIKINKCKVPVLLSTQSVNQVCEIGLPLFSPSRRLFSLKFLFSGCQFWEELYNMNSSNFDETSCISSTFSCCKFLLIDSSTFTISCDTVLNDLLVHFHGHAVVSLVHFATLKFVAFFHK